MSKLNPRSKRQYLRERNVISFVVNPPLGTQKLLSCHHHADYPIWLKRLLSFDWAVGDHVTGRVVLDVIHNFSPQLLDDLFKSDTSDHPPIKVNAKLLASEEIWIDG